jgi:hypothetical protein
MAAAAVNQVGNLVFWCNVNSGDLRVGRAAHPMTLKQL